MAFNLSEIGGYGAGDSTYSSKNATKFNLYAQITSIEENAITISTEKTISGSYGAFDENIEIMVHVCAVKSGTDTTMLGRYFVATVTNSATNAKDKTQTLTLSKSPTEILGADILSSYYLQAITIPSFSSIDMNSEDVIQPAAFDAAKYCGGVLAFKVTGDFKINGGKIKLTDLGIPTAQKTLRPTLKQEESGTGLQDVNLYAGWENWMTRDRLLLNVGDGAAFIVAKTIQGHEDSRIGNVESYGVQYCRGASDSVGGKPSNTTNIGGSTILIACDDFLQFSPKIISKYRAANSAAGQGLARCYIASKSTTLRIDEGLYSFDIIEDSSRLVQNLNIRNFGSGSLGDVTNSTAQLNNYAKITAVSSDGYRLTYTGKTAIGLAPISNGALVMIHSSQSIQAATEATASKIGRFCIATILNDNGTTITLDYPVSEFINPSTHYCQIVSIPQFQNFTLSGSYTATPKFNNSVGGICAIAVKGTCNLSNGRVNVEYKGGDSTLYGDAGLSCIGNAQNYDKLPLGSGHGSVLILANKIVMNSATRIGATYSGANFGGAGQQKGSNYTAVKRGGYRGSDYEVYGGSPYQRSQGNKPSNNGGNGTGSNGMKMSGYYGPQGAHIMLVADTIEGFNIAGISTGGSGGLPTVGYGAKTGDYYAHAGAGYGGGGADNGYGASSGGFIGAGGGGGGGDPLTAGGSTGFAFIYCNNFTNPINTGMEI